MDQGADRHSRPGMSPGAKRGLVITPGPVCAATGAALRERGSA